MTLPFPTKTVLYSIPKWPWWQQHDYSTVLRSSKFLWRKRGTIQKWACGRNEQFQERKRIILKCPLFFELGMSQILFFSFAFENSNHCSKKVENFFRSNHFLTRCFYLFSLYTAWKSLGTSCCLKCIIMLHILITSTQSMSALFYSLFKDT